MDPSLDFLERLFGIDGRPAVENTGVKLRVVRRAGHPFLLLPRHPREAVAALNLYAPQTIRARLARALLLWPIQLSVPFPGERICFDVSPKAPFVEFLSSLLDEVKPLGFGILAGNPSSPGQRFLVLCFNAEHRPFAVVKTALTQRGHELIQHEESFLSAVPSRLQGRGIPAIQAIFDSEEIRAFATGFTAGRSPRGHDEMDLPLLLNSWVDSDREVALAEMPVWIKLEEACAAQRPFQAISPGLRSRRVHPCVQHGDFVPWNIKISREGVWTVLDWERGELTGIPGWDWFHYVIQTGILVKHQTTTELVRRAENLLAADSFKDYASRSGISTIARELMLGYLFHLTEVIRPSEGLIQSRELLTALAERWQIGDA
jgi:hypothetical protein